MKAHRKTFIVTGGGSGMGKEIVLQLLDKQARVAAVDMNENSLEELVQLAGINATRLSIHTVDICDKMKIQALPEEVISIHGSLDGLINNAGIIQPFVKVNDLDFDTIDRVMNVNFYGLLYLTKACLPHLLERPEAHIVNISSMGGFLPVPGQSVYGASKAAIKLLTEALYAELLTSNVHVTIVFPGAVLTNITKNSGVEIKIDPSKQNSSMKSMSASDAASVIISGMEKNKFRILVGKDSKFMDLLYRLNPGFATRFIRRKMESLLNN